MLLADFITSPLTHKSFGLMIAKQIVQIWNYYKNPKYFDYQQKIHSEVYEVVGITEKNPNLVWRKEWK